MSAPPTQPCACCSVPVPKRGHRRPGGDWFCPAPPCRSEARRRRYRRARLTRGLALRTADVCERCGRSYYPMPGGDSPDRLCSRRECHRERIRRADRRDRAARGIPQRRTGGPAYPPELAARVREAYTSGLSVRGVAAELGMRPTAVRDVMLACGIPRRSQSEAQRLAAARRAAA